MPRELINDRRSNARKPAKIADTPERFDYDKSTRDLTGYRLAASFFERHTARERTRPRYS